MATRAERNFLKLPYAEHRSNDEAAMKDAIELLSRYHGEVRRPNGNDYQLKLSSAVSFYPRTGKIHVDGEPKGRMERGPMAVLEVLKKRMELVSP